MKRLLYIILCITAILSFAGCSKAIDSKVIYDIPEGEELQKTLDEMAAAILAKDIDAYSNFVTSSCPQKSLNIKRLKEAFLKAPFSKYSLVIKKASRAGAGITCTVEINAEKASDEKNSYIDSGGAKKVTSEYFFIKEDDGWKLADFNFHAILNPSVVVGNQSIIYDSALQLAKSLNSKLYTDVNSFQLYGDLVLIGEPYENASIIDLELGDHTALRVTDEYPGEGKGVVQVLSSIHDYRYVITIQGSNSSTTIMAVDFMGKYIKENPFISPGVYIIENNEIRTAKPLEISVFSNYDIKKAEARMAAVQKTIEQNISFIQDEITSEKDQLLKLQNAVDNSFMEDYYTAFTGYNQNTNSAQSNGMIMIAADSTNKDLCAAVFELPADDSEGAIYAFSDYASQNIMNITSASYVTSLLRLSGFDENQVFNSLIASDTLNFFNISTGYLFDASEAKNTSVKKNYPAEEIIGLENDSKFVNYKSFTSNMTKDNISTYAGMLNSLYESSKDLTESRIKRNEFKIVDGIASQPFTYNSDFVLSMLKSSTLEDDSLPLYSSLAEAKEQLRAAMGEFLSIKSTEFLYNMASKYPGSQYDYGRYAAGLLNVEHPNVYAQAATKAKLVEKTGGEIKMRKIDYDYRLEDTINFLETIDNGDPLEGKFISPDLCMINKKGSPRDKALVAFGLYLNVFGKDENAYVALGRESAYLAFERNEEWRFLDCKSNNITDYLDDDIYMAFNTTDVYNDEIDLGEIPEFMK